MSTPNERDLKQRTFGTIGFSIVAHVGLLAVLMFGPRPSAKEIAGLDSSQGTAGSGGEIALIEAKSGEPAAEGSASATTAPAQVETPRENLVAAASDPQAVSVPAKKPEPVATPAPPVATPIPQPKPIKPKPVKLEKPPAKKAAAPPVSKNTLTEESSDVDVKPETLTPAIEAQPDEQAELAAARASRDVEEEESAKTEAAPAPQPIPKTAESALPAKSVAKRDERAEKTPEPIVAGAPKSEVSAEEKTSAAPTQIAVNEAADKPGVADSGLGGTGSQNGGSGKGEGAGRASKVAGPGVGPTNTGASGVPAGSPIRDADKLTLLSTKPFTYPQADRLANRSGTTFLVAKIRPDGSVTDVSIERSSGSSTMDQEAVKTFRLWKFMPGQEGFVRKPVQFVLKGDAQEMKAKLSR